MAAAPSLATLQNLVRRDPDGYTEEVGRRLRHFQSLLALVEQQPGSSPADFLPLLSFVSHIAACFPSLMADLPEGLGRLLEERHDVLEPAVRRALLQALVLLRNRGMVPPLALLQRCFRLFRCRDKTLRARLYAYVVTDIKTANRKARDQPLNRALQNHVIHILQEPSSVGAKYALRAMIELYRRQVWRDAKTVNVIASALFCPHPKLRIAALHFLLGAHDAPRDGEDSEEEELQEARGAVSKLREQLGGKDGSHESRPGRCVHKKKRKLQRAMRSTKSRGKAEAAASLQVALEVREEVWQLQPVRADEAREEVDHQQPHLESFTLGQCGRLEVRLLMINLLSRLVGAHRLQLPNFFPYLQRYLQPHQRDITLLLAYLADFEAQSSDDVGELSRARDSQMTSHTSIIGHGRMKRGGGRWEQHGAPLDETAVK
ncbi:hypothetical protein EMIHUDRAFT_242784 [Emiliania huxleyi CCMP1516]|uniref:Protein SDA1 n=2 Tax=Emiliania huxleyi TaxID=2903 RepID=A0A0D3J837_EMIH1|nr:hypothetical protein EMIHUDRAFT_242784 [Emiliania huxleyi CCMP1516]EOD19672.1 hypothetical protein EMIHUDRAFT_242784 [Emiliania huxleyi CCMP1516]|eukprot:XP_005772101.1 hypothetical protein EMIHUDRAFT_242784 [Emiliania huxleyi CCMP1516]